MPAPAAPPLAKPASGPARALAKLGLTSAEALALHLPLRWEDEATLTPIARLRPGSVAQVQGVVVAQVAGRAPRRSLNVTLEDAAGHQLLLRFLHSYPGQVQALAVGRQVRALGEVRGGLLGVEMVHPQVRAWDGEAPPLPATLTPVYPTTAQLPQAYLRKAVAGGLARADLHELLPPRCLPGGLPPLREALQLLHHPPAGTPVAALQDASHPAWQRLKFEELLAQQLGQWQARLERAQRQATPLVATRGLPQRLQAALGFALTAAQQRVVAEIAADLAREQPMHRLLQGDVGAGKTVVAALAAAVAVDAGFQCALMAPTEILAEQHLRKIVDWLQPLGVEVAWLAGSRRGRARREALAAIAEGRAQLVVGTHAVIQADVQFANLALAIVDEQHRFGVAQRLALRQASQASPAAQPGAAPPREPHLLMMSATPIPRTLAMTLFADVDVSTIDTLPPGRTPILTKAFAEQRRGEVITRLQAHLAQGRQAYWVCPLVEESEALDLQNAVDSHAALAAALPGWRVGLLHGRMKAADKAATMAAFEAGQVHLLVATTVVEVGVDVPNATLMVIEHAERFGLAQLHQLRGRVGRGQHASACVLLHATPLGEVAQARLRALLQTSDGFEIAQRDLAIRGPGDVLGQRQSGQALLRFADPIADAALAEQARQQAHWLWAHEPAAAQAQIRRWLGARMDWLGA